MPNFLDVDPSLLERNLMFDDIVKDSNGISEESLFNIKPKENSDIPWKPVKPNPGYCVKLKTVEGDKVFVNVCHTDAIPEPVEMSEEELLKMINDDEVPSFKIPISIGDLHIESDKARNPCSVYDIAVNTKFFQKMESSEVFNIFFLNVSVTALQEKYNLTLDLKSEKPFLLLKNRKVLGSLQIHRIQQREVKKAPGQLIQEISSKQTEEKEPLIEEISNKKLLIEEINNKKSASTSSSNNAYNKVPSTSSQSKSRNENLSVQTPSSSASNYLNSRISPNVEDSEKGIKESHISKDNSSIKHKQSSGTSGIQQHSTPAHEGLGDTGERCSGFFCIKQYPETGHPDFIVASVHMDVKSSKDFDLEVDENRICITVLGSDCPWIDFYHPFNIDVNKVEACFIKESKKLIIKMDVIN